MPTTPEELYDNVVLTVEKQQKWVEDLILEKLGLNWDVVSLPAAGEHSVPFKQPYATGDTNYIVQGKAFSLAHPTEDIGFTVREQNKNYLKVWVSEPCLLSFITLSPKVTL